MNETTVGEPSTLRNPHPRRRPVADAHHRILRRAPRNTPGGHLSRVAAVALMVLLGCGGGDEPSAGPPEIRYGLEECNYCRMIISQEKFAAATLDENGTAISFDDVGCLVDYLRAQRSGRPSPGEPAAANNVWVHDHAGDGWIAAEPAWFVRDSRGLTPMGSGLTAFAMRPDAEAFAGDRGWQVMGWPALLDRPSREWPGSPSAGATPESPSVGATPESPSETPESPSEATSPPS